MSGLSAETRPSPADRVLSFVERIFPAPSAWAFALRIWLAMVLALYAGFWLQLSGASSAAVCVAILAQPKRGQALSKALYRFLGTLAGGAISILLIGAFGQDRVLLLVSVATWLGLCVFVAHFLQDTRAYGAMLAGFTVAIVAVAHIDTPQAVFEAAIDRVAAITIGIVAITFINDALASPSTWRTLRKPLSEALSATRAFARETLSRADPGSERAAALIRQIAVMRADASAIGGELDDGARRAAGARSTIAALYAMAAASRAFTAAAAMLEHESDAVAEARRICLGLTDDGTPDADAAAHRLGALVDEAIQSGTSEPLEILALQRGLDFARAASFAEDGLNALSTGCRPKRDVALPTHRDLPVALRGAARVGIAFGATALLLIAAGWPATSFALVQVAATCSLSAIAPDSKAFARGVLIGMPVRGALRRNRALRRAGGRAGLPTARHRHRAGDLRGVFSQPEPADIRNRLHPARVLHGPPVAVQPADLATCRASSANAFLVTMAACILFVAVRIVTADLARPAPRLRPRFGPGFGAGRAGRRWRRRHHPHQPQQRSAAAILAMEFGQRRRPRGEPGTVPSTWPGLESAASRAHAQLCRLPDEPSLNDAARQAREGLEAADTAALSRSVRAFLRHSRSVGAPTRLDIARLVSDLVTAGGIMESQHRLLRRLGILRPA